MKLQFYLALLFLVLFSQIENTKPGNGDLLCRWKDNGYTYDFSPLKNTTGNYLFKKDDIKMLYVFNVCEATVDEPNSICKCCSPSKEYTAFSYNTTTMSCKEWGEWKNGYTYKYIDPNNDFVGVTISNPKSQTSSSYSVAINLFCNEEETFNVFSVYEYDTIPPHMQINAASYTACRAEPTPTPSPTPDPYFCQTIQSNELYNLAPSKKLYKFTTPDNKYWLHPCDYVVHTSGCDCCTAGVATGWIQRSDGSCQQLGHLDTSTWLPLPENDPREGVSLEYYVKTSLGHKTRSMKYDFVCDPATDGDITEINELNLIPPRTEITLASKYACPQDPLNPTIYPSPTVKSSPTSSPSSNTGGLSGGLVFLVVLLVGIACFICGFFVHRYRTSRSNMYENL
ncbi:lysosomal enzyme receptor protein isoform e [Anaeramoeba flamelloides]|uniref:Lysosomal enzyme receptor protein isoform e n=1 Tax=Anaeramoeba flamelloides TaxID=1746091 RepID=A0AAV7Z6J9_9EUKA|nr:lysosomal enzyme receptor protein isoform e [Anaeramoeba flamelloides]